MMMWNDNIGRLKFETFRSFLIWKMLMWTNIKSLLKILWTSA